MVVRGGLSRNIEFSSENRRFDIVAKKIVWVGGTAEWSPWSMVVQSNFYVLTLTAPALPFPSFFGEFQGIKIPKCKQEFLSAAVCAEMRPRAFLTSWTSIPLPFSITSCCNNTEYRRSQLTRIHRATMGTKVILNSRLRSTC